MLLGSYMPDLQGTADSPAINHHQPPCRIDGTQPFAQKLWAIGRCVRVSDVLVPHLSATDDLLNFLSHGPRMHITQHPPDLQRLAFRTLLSLLSAGW